MLQIVEQTKEEKMAMYMKLPKKQIAEMLINCNDVITALTQSKNCVIPVVSVSLLADFLKYAIDETMRISGDHDGNAGTLYVDDTYEKIADDYISICNER